MLFNAGEEIVGKWHGERIVLQRRLGSGAHGTVYLALWKRQSVVIKIGTEAVNISAEINRLITLNKAQEAFPGPRLLGYDDVEKDGNVYSFYIMSYQSGVPFNEVLQRKNGGRSHWLWIVLQLLDHLERLHQAGYVFGDWKPQHIVVHPADDSVRFVDLGGVTPIGQELRQWTAVYDRGNWQAGLRVADQAYDLFAVTLLILSEVLCVPLSSIKPEQQHLQTLYDIIRNKTRLSPAFRDLFMQAVRGQIHSARDYAQAFTVAAGSGLTVQRAGHNRRKRVWEACFACSTALFFSILYIVMR